MADEASGLDYQPAHRTGLDCMPIITLEGFPSRMQTADLRLQLAKLCDLPRQGWNSLRPEGRRALLDVPADQVANVLARLDGARVGDRRLRAWVSGGAQTGRQTDFAADPFGHLARLLRLEQAAAAERFRAATRQRSLSDLERAGQALGQLRVADEDAGLGGRHLVALQRPGSELPWTRLGPGTPVWLSPQDDAGEAARGILTRLDRGQLEIAFEHRPETLDEHERFRVDQADDATAFDRQFAALERARTARGDGLATLRDALLGARAPRFTPAEKVRDVGPLDPALNAPQAEAVALALQAQDFALLHGPPGTGKTTAVVELIRRAIRSGQKVLACAPSNLAVDNLVERLAAQGERVVRLGHPARVLETLRAHTLDLLVAEHPDVRLAGKLVKEALALQRQAARYTRARPEPGARQQQRAAARELFADARRLRAAAAEQLLDQADVVCATLTGLDSQVLGQRRFDLLVIDEAAQATEPACWIALGWAGRVVLSGDHQQLPPTILSQPAAAAGLSESLFERLMAQHGESVSRLLTVQYRMHQQIMEFPAEQFYDGLLEAHSSVAAHALGELFRAGETAEPPAPVEFVDSAGAGWEETPETDGESRCNVEEARYVAARVERWLAAGLAPEQIGVLSPYAAQVRLLRELLAGSRVEIDSVDGFQGREKEALLVSLVRSNPRGELGFLTDLRRLNVAWTRARRKLVLVGDSATLARHEFFQAAVEYCEARGGYRSVWEDL